MKVRMRVSIAGHAMPHYGINGTFSLAPGDELELHDELAKKWTASGHAEEIADAPSEDLEKKPSRRSKKERE